MTGRAKTVDSLGAILDREIGGLVASESEPGLPTGDTSAGGMSPLEAALLSISQDVATMLRLARQIQEQGHALQQEGRTIETVARALVADMEKVKRACGSRTRT